MGVSTMFHFILYEDDPSMITKYTEVIQKLFDGYKNCYEIHPAYHHDDIKKYESIKEQKIYIIDIEVPGCSGLELAKKIRNSGDWRSPIIIISNYENFQHTDFTKKMLTLDFISKKDDVSLRLFETLSLSYQILTAHRTFCFQQNNEIYQIPFRDILYFEKVLHENTCSLVTLNGNYIVHSSISNIEKKLGNDLRFFKTHQSCIVNLHNVELVDLKKRKIDFCNGKEINLLSRDKRNVIKQKMTNHMIIY